MGNFDFLAAAVIVDAALIISRVFEVWIDGKMIVAIVAAVENDVFFVHSIISLLFKNFVAAAAAAAAAASPNWVEYCFTLAIVVVFVAVENDVLSVYSIILQLFKNFITLADAGTDAAFIVAVASPIQVEYSYVWVESLLKLKGSL